MEKKQTKSLTVKISPEIYKKIKENSYNANSLVNGLLEEYIKETKK
jgi:hypothetical protein